MGKRVSFSNFNEHSIYLFKYLRKKVINVVGTLDILSAIKLSSDLIQG